MPIYLADHTGADALEAAHHRVADAAGDLADTFAQLAASDPNQPIELTLEDIEAAAQEAPKLTLRQRRERFRARRLINELLRRTPVPSRCPIKGCHGTLTRISPTEIEQEDGTATPWEGPIEYRCSDVTRQIEHESITLEDGTEERQFEGVFVRRGCGVTITEYPKPAGQVTARLQQPKPTRRRGVSSWTIGAPLW